MGLKAILDGHAREALGLNQDISEMRMAICLKCPLYKETIAGPVCNHDLYLNTETGEISTTAKMGFKHGCGCRLKAKTRLPYAKCPTGQW